MKKKLQAQQQEEGKKWVKIAFLNGSRAVSSIQTWSSSHSASLSIDAVFGFTSSFNLTSLRSHTRFTRFALVVSSSRHIKAFSSVLLASTSSSRRYIDKTRRLRANESRSHLATIFFHLAKAKARYLSDYDYDLRQFRRVSLLGTFLTPQLTLVVGLKLFCHFSLALFSFLSPLRSTRLPTSTRLSASLSMTWNLSIHCCYTVYFFNSLTLFFLMAKTENRRVVADRVVKKEWTFLLSSSARLAPPKRSPYR